MRPENSDANAGRCICPSCPTYYDCMKEGGERLYCSRGETACNPSAKRCICGECPVWTEHDLSSYYFCMDGAAS